MRRASSLISRLAASRSLGPEIEIAERLPVLVAQMKRALLGSSHVHGGGKQRGGGTGSGQRRRSARNR
jgi:hypothetical protein